LIEKTLKEMANLSIKCQFKSDLLCHIFIENISQIWGQGYLGQNWL